MPSAVPPPNLEGALKRYESGATIAECAALCGLARETFRQRVVERQLPLRGRGGGAASRRLEAPSGLAEAYMDGQSVKALAAKHHISRPTVERMLREIGIDPRGRSEAMRIRWQNAGPEDRKRMLDAPHAAVRGTSPSRETQMTRAHARRGIPMSPLETALGGLFIGLGHDVEYATPLDTYNLDLVIDGTLAIEVFGGNWHEAGRHRASFAERSRRILDAGYSLAIVWVHETRYPIGLKCAQSLGTLVDITRSLAGRHYWVVRGDGHFLAVRQDDGSEVPFVTASGRHERP